MSGRGRGRGAHTDSGQSSSQASRGGRGGGGRGGRGERGRGKGTQRGRGGGFDAGPQVFRPSDGSQPQPDKKVEILESKLVQASGKSILGLAELSLNEDVPYRPGHGTRGEPVVLWTNYFQIIPRKDVSVFRYSIDISPEVQNRRLKARIINLFLAESPISTLAPGVASDYQANIITVRKLIADEIQADITYRDEGAPDPSSNAKIYKVRLGQHGSYTVADLIDFLTSSSASAAFSDKPQMIQALNIVLNNASKSKDPRTALSTRNNVHFSVQGSFAEGFNLGAGLQAWRGYFTSVRIAASRLLVNTQIKHAAMYKSVRLDELMVEFQQQRGRDFSIMARFLRHVRIDRLHLKRKNGHGPPRPKTINGLATPLDGRGLANPPKAAAFGATAKQVKFFVSDDAPKPLKSNTYVTIFDYFDKVHGIQAKAALPVVNVGNKDNPSYLPPEVCFVIPAQPAVAKLSSDQTAQMIRFAVRRPFENARSISEIGLSEVGLVPQNAVMAAFGLQVQPQMLTVQARILPPPGMRYAQNKLTIPRFGAWNMGDLRFSGGSSLEKWSILWLRSGSMPDPWNESASALTSTLEEFRQTLNKCGMRCSPPQLPGKSVNVDAGNDKAAIQEGFKELMSRRRNEKLLLVIIPRRDDGLYNLIKQCGDVQFGVHTVCVVANKFAKPNNVQYFANVALKFNLKLGGTNQTLDTDKLGFIAQGKTMVVGIDVTHPSPGSDNSAPSVAAMVASIRKDLGQFPAVLHAQNGRQENVADLTNMLKSRLGLWQKNNQNHLPENILVYRDGVSEGQYPIVINQELPLLRQACREVYPAKGNQPAISIIIVGKRHSTRFYPTSTDRDNIDERSSNPKHGTIVDRGITEPRNWDFYLQAHTALQGTARPAHYFVVHDEIFRRLTIPPGFANVNDVLEDITHNLCYMFGRATKAVSYCPPAYYADLVCERARCYLSHVFAPDASRSSSTIGGSATVTGYQQSLRMHDAIKDSMFYI